MSLTTGKKLSRQQWTKLPIPDGAIAAVEAMAEAEEQPTMGNGGSVFEWSQGMPILDENVAPIVVHEVDHHKQEEEEEVVVNDCEDEENDVACENQDDHAPEDNEEVPQEAEGEPGHDDDHELPPAEEGEATADDVANNDHGGHFPEPEPAPRCNLWANRERTCDHRLAQSMDNPESSKSCDVQFSQHGASPHQGRRDPESDALGSCNAEFLKQRASAMPTLREAVEVFMASGSGSEVQNHILGFIVTQMTAKAGIKKHGQAAIDALHQEFLQLHDLGVFEGQHAKDLAKEQRRSALRAISVIKKGDVARSRAAPLPTEGCREPCTLKTRLHPLPHPQML